jgi:membrane fusion protein, multidrug efflux system
MDGQVLEDLLVMSLRRIRWLWLWVSVGVLLAGLGSFFRENGGLPAGAQRWGSLFRSRKLDSSAAPPARNPQGSRAVPVVAARARKGSIGVYFTGLGTVIPIYTVTIKSRVDGQLMAVHFKEGDIVHQGDLLVEIDARPYQAALVQAEGNLIRDQALLANARIDLTRYETLLTQNAAPEQQVATQKALVTQYEGTVKTDQGVIDAAKVNVDYCKITAPVTGLVGLRLVDPGNIVHATDTTGMLVITQMQPTSVIFTIAEDQLAIVLRKLTAGEHLPVEAYDREMKTKIGTGVLVTLDNQIDQTTGTLRLRANFDNRKNELYPNQFVNARLLVEEKRGVTLIPAAAIQRTSQSTYVYLVKDGCATVRPITVGTVEGDDAEIVSGVSPGDAVVLTGVDQLQEGAAVSVTTAETSGRAGG